MQDEKAPSTKKRGSISTAALPFKLNSMARAGRAVQPENHKPHANQHICLLFRDSLVLLFSRTAKALQNVVPVLLQVPPEFTSSLTALVPLSGRAQLSARHANLAAPSVVRSLANMCTLADFSLPMLAGTAPTLTPVRHTAWGKWTCRGLSTSVEYSKLP